MELFLITWAKVGNAERKTVNINSDNVIVEIKDEKLGKTGLLYLPKMAIVVQGNKKYLSKNDYKEIILRNDSTIELHLEKSIEGKYEPEKIVPDIDVAILKYDDDGFHSIFPIKLEIIKRNRLNYNESQQNQYIWEMIVKLYIYFTPTIERVRIIYEHEGPLRAYVKYELTLRNDSLIEVKYFFLKLPKHFKGLKIKDEEGKILSYFSRSTVKKIFGIDIPEKINFVIVQLGTIAPSNMKTITFETYESPTATEIATVYEANFNLGPGDKIQINIIPPENYQVLLKLPHGDFVQCRYNEDRYNEELLEKGDRSKTELHTEEWHNCSSYKNEKEFYLKSTSIVDVGFRNIQRGQNADQQVASIKLNYKLDLEENSKIFWDYMIAMLLMTTIQLILIELWKDLKLFSFYYIKNLPQGLSYEILITILGGIISLFIFSAFVEETSLEETSNSIFAERIFIKRMMKFDYFKRLIRRKYTWIYLILSAFLIAEGGVNYSTAHGPFQTIELALTAIAGATFALVDKNVRGTYRRVLVLTTMLALLALLLNAI
ncbi:hypothetical protein [Caldisphaera sp.]|uniref:hypothetical protein n=1 Tax=Caldisphaera sp. TaxID=2060322 RepID=UPI0025C3E43C|nr:hypothetical protein [Caldisphaera sp.]